MCENQGVVVRLRGHRVLTSWFVGGRQIVDEKAHEDQCKQPFVLM